MRWLFEATIEDLRDSLPTWVAALERPEVRDVLDPYTRIVHPELTYNPTPRANFEDPPEEAPPPFPHVAIWEPEPRASYVALFEAITGRVMEGDPYALDGPIGTTLFREVLCGRPGGPIVHFVPPEIRIESDVDVDALAQRWVACLEKRTRQPPRAEWIASAKESLGAIARFSAEHGPPWFAWEDAFDW